MFTSRRVTRTLALACAAAAIAAPSATAAPTQEPAQMSAAAAPQQVAAPMSSYGLGADVDRSTAVEQRHSSAQQRRPVPMDDNVTSAALSQERYYATYGRPGPIARPPVEPDSDVEWPIVGLIGVVGLLIAAGAFTAIRKVRVRGHQTRVAA